MKNLKAILAAGLILSSAFTSSCSLLYKQDEIPTPEPTAPSAAPAVTLDTEPADPNVPQFVETGSNAATSGGNADTDDVSAASPTETQPPVSIPDAESQKVGEDGMIIDDWRAGLNINNGEKVSELYEQFRIDAAMREGYYNMICQDSAIPVIHISTEDEREILSLDDYVNCLVEVMNCDDIYKLTASGGIRVRGNASAYYGDTEKIRDNPVPYRIKFDEKQSMLGLNDYARCKSWVLLRTYEAGVRDHLAFRIAKAINDGDYYVSDSTFVQLYINEKYMGLYLLCEQTQENSQRIDITEAEDGYTGTDIGYLVELDNYAADDDDPFFYLVYNREEITDIEGTVRVPRKYAYSVKNDLYSEEQLKFIERYFEVAWEISMRAIKYGEFLTYDDEFNLIPAQDQFASAYECINAVIDVQSVVDMYMTYEIVNDQDVGGGSFFFAVDFSEQSKYPRLTMVAPWDFDWAYSDYYSSADGGLYVAKFKDEVFINGDRSHNGYGDRSNPWLILFYSADWFRGLVSETWKARLEYIRAAMDEVEATAVEYSDDFNKDGTRRAGKAVATINWARSRVDFLDTLWG